MPAPHRVLCRRARLGIDCLGADAGEPSDAAGQGADLRLGRVEHHADDADAPVAVGVSPYGSDMLLLSCSIDAL